MGNDHRHEKVFGIDSIAQLLLNAFTGEMKWYVKCPVTRLIVYLGALLEFGRLCLYRRVLQRMAGARWRGSGS